MYGTGILYQLNYSARHFIRSIIYARLWVVVIRVLRRHSIKKMLKMLFPSMSSDKILTTHKATENMTPKRICHSGYRWANYF
jgi:hypothetical protein